MSERMVGCADVRESLQLYLDGEADELSCEQIQFHLQSCPGCARAVEEETALKELVRRSCGCQPAPPVLRDRILARLSGITVTQSSSRVLYSDADGVTYVETHTTRVETWEG